MKYIENTLWIFRALCILLLATCFFVGKVPDDQLAFLGIMTGISIAGILLTTLLMWIIEKFTTKSHKV